VKPVALAFALLLGLSGRPVSASPPPRQPVRPSAVAAGGFVYVAAMGPVDESGKVAGADVRAQTARALDNLARLLVRHGSRMAQVAAVTVYLRNQADFPTMNEVYARYWPKDPPTRTTVVVPLADPEALVEIGMVSLADGVERRVIQPPSWVRPSSPYSYGIQSGDTLFLSGLLSRNGRDNSVIPGNMRAQTEAVLANAAEILSAASMTMADVVSARVYITDTAMFQDMNSAYRASFPSSPPARATVRAGLTSSPHLIEITLLAVRGAGRQAITTPNADLTPGTPNPLLSAAVRLGNRLFLSGMLGATAVNRGDAAAQARETLARIGRTIEAAGFKWADVAEATLYVPTPADVPAVNSAWREVFGSTAPARTIVQAGLVSPDARVEIMMTAARR
jgi:enamine deaminase RidA (YjgF/YER057c/UK114 family)